MTVILSEKCAVDSCRDCALRDGGCSCVCHYSQCCFCTQEFVVGDVLMQFLEWTDDGPEPNCEHPLCLGYMHLACMTQRLRDILEGEA